jgi:transcriptional regulator with XRE-family HTH domain
MPLAQVRRHFGLDQATLAAYLGMGAGMVGHLEAGRKTLSLAATRRLLPLLQALPAPAAAAATATDPAAYLAPPDTAPLAARLDYCQHHAARLRRELAALTQQLEVARRWQQALPTLLAQAAAQARPWLLRRQEQAAADLDGEAAARYHLLRLRAEALESEASALRQLLAATKKAPPAQPT